MTETIKTREAVPEPWPPEDDAELVAMSKQREREYELEQLDHELGLDEPEVGRDLMVAASAILRRRGINPDDATEEQLLDALMRVSR